MNVICVRGLVIGKGKPKICIPIVGKDKESIFEQAKAAVEAGAQLVEWRVDHFEEYYDTMAILEVLEQLRSIIGNRPLLYTFRTSDEGGASSICKYAYRKVNECAINSGFIDLVDVEIQRDETAVTTVINTAHEKGVYVIASMHDFEKTPNGMTLINQLKLMQSKGADILKLAMMPQGMQDVLKLWTVTCECPEYGITQPLITISMGEMGGISRVAGEYFGSAITFGAAGDASAPGQFDAKQLHQVLDILHETMEKPKEHLYLVGFMGTGKSSVAKELSKMTNRMVLEMDETIVNVKGQSIPEIFEHVGEEGFRDIESSLLKEIAGMAQQQFIVSCGGGAVLRNENIQMMKTSGTTILLTASPLTIFSRIAGDENRPNIKNYKTPEEIGELMVERQESYIKAADIIVKTDGKSIGDICREILEKV